MGNDIRRSKLTLVQKGKSKVPSRVSLSPGDGDQQSLFPTSPSLFVFLEMSRMQEREFCGLISEIRPRVVIDVRAVSRFDIGQLNRPKALRMFKENNSYYFEAPKLFRADDVELTNESYAAFHSHMKSLLNKRKLVGPVVVLVHQFKAEAAYLRFIPKLLPPPTKSGWDIYSIP